MLYDLQLDYSHSLPPGLSSGVPPDKDKIACTSMAPEILIMQSLVNAYVCLESWFWLPVRAGLMVRGPGDVFLKHGVNPNEFQVPIVQAQFCSTVKTWGFFHFFRNAVINHDAHSFFK